MAEETVVATSSLLQDKGPVSSGLSSDSVKSDASKEYPPDFSEEKPRPFKDKGRGFSGLSSDSVKSDASKEYPPDFSKEPRPLNDKGGGFAGLSSDSVKSDASKEYPPNFSDDMLSSVSVKSDASKEYPPDFSKKPRPREDKGRVFSGLSSDSMKSDASKEYPPDFSKEKPSQGKFGRANETVASSVEETDQTEDDPLNFKQEKDDNLKFTAGLKKTILNRYEKFLSPLKTQDTKLYEKVKNNEDKQKPLETKYSDIFKKEERTVLTSGVAGIGKTVQAGRFMVDWAKQKSSKELMVLLDFSKLNSMRDKVQSMEDLLNYFSEVKQPQVSTYDKCKLVFVLDSLEKCKLPLDFGKNKDVTDMKEEASMDVLLTNLIKGNLLHTARLWIISQPSGIAKIPPELIQKVTECRETLERRRQLASKLRKRFLKENTHIENIDHPNQKNTEHILRGGSSGEVGNEKENLKVEVKDLLELFKDAKEKTNRIILTIGEANIGKSYHVQKFKQTWAKSDRKGIFPWIKDKAKSLFSRAEEEVEVLFLFNFEKLIAIKEQQLSLMELLNHFFKETKEIVVSSLSQFKVIFVLDGFDASQLPLHFDHEDELTDVRKPASVGGLLTNLIKGNLLPEAKVWITSRPPAAKQLPESIVDKMTEIREKPDVASQRKVKSQLKKQFTRVSEGIDGQKTSALLKNIYTDVYIIEGERGEVNQQHESKQVQDAKFRQETPIKYHDIFKPSPVQNTAIKTVLTIGVAGIGKTFASIKYMLDWAEDAASENFNFTFPLPFRELNLRKDKDYSLEELIHQFFPAMETSEIINYDKYRILIVLDGLDECRPELEFSNNTYLTDVRKPASVNVLLGNLIQGNLLPKAKIWITSRPAASNHIPVEKVDRVTEVRGFNDEQKEEYFRKRFSDEVLAEKILSHVKKSRSLYIMCHIPVFCWITSKVLEDFVNEDQQEGMPKTLTDMYTRFLFLECKQANVKYSGGENKSETDSCWNTRNKDTVLSLGKLAFEELEKGNLLFTEENLTERGINITNAAVFSGLFTQIKREDHGLYQQKLFCFVHLSIHEFLAALYASYAFNNNGENLLTTPASVVSDGPTSDFYKQAVDKALDSKNGEWDLFLRFLLGLSVENNQKLLVGLHNKTENSKDTYQETVEYIKKKLDEDMSDADKNLNLFHCLNELNDHSLVKRVKEYLQSETVDFETFTPSQWSALTFVLLTSDEKLAVFDLKNFLKSEKVLLGMLPVVKVSKTTLLSWCELSEKSCGGLATSVLSCPSSNLTELDLSHNDLLDSGVQQLAGGLQSLHCKLETLKLVGCQVAEKGCSDLASALRSNTASRLKKLDLSYNHPGDNGKRMLSAIADDPNTKLESVCLKHDGEHRLKPGLKKYGADLMFDESTAGKRLVLSEGNKKVRTAKKAEERVKPAENERRFLRSQVLCDEGLEGFCYWEVEWEVDWKEDPRGMVGIAVCYDSVSRTRDSSGGLGCNEGSWSLLCSREGNTAMHGSQKIKRKWDHPCRKIAVFLDWEGGSVTYFSVSAAGELSHIHTFQEDPPKKFTEPLFPGFWFKTGSVTLCDLH